MHHSPLEDKKNAWVYIRSSKGTGKICVWDNDPTYKMHNLKFYASIVLQKVCSYMYMGVVTTVVNAIRIDFFV